MNPKSNHSCLIGREEDRKRPRAEAQVSTEAERLATVCLTLKGPAGPAPCLPTSDLLKYETINFCLKLLSVCELFMPARGHSNNLPDSVCELSLCSSPRASHCHRSSTQHIRRPDILACLGTEGILGDRIFGAQTVVLVS